MDLERIIDPEYGLQQDEWSLSKPILGGERQLEVVGWSGKLRKHRYYILKCSVCLKDGELFGEGYFKAVKGHLVRGLMPCGCAKQPRWSKEQYVVLCSRKAEKLGYTFIRFIGMWKGQNTKIKMLCEKHGEWDTGIIHNLINKGVGCPGCKLDALAKPDEEMIASFLASGAFHPNTKFWRSAKMNSRGDKVYWYMECPICGQIGESQSSNLQLGSTPCYCSRQNQQEGYINLVLDGLSTVALKFGIAKDSKRRVKQQNSKSSYALEQHSVYTFPDVYSCKTAEKECLQELECGVISKRDMPDGWTETTWVCNLDKIIKIYETNGGIKLKDVTVSSENTSRKSS